MDKIQGDGEKWQAFSKGGTKGFYIECLGAEKGKLLSHAFGKIWLQEGYQGEGELWRSVRQSVNTNSTDDSIRNKALELRKGIG